MEALLNRFCLPSITPLGYVFAFMLSCSAFGAPKKIPLSFVPVTDLQVMTKYQGLALFFIDNELDAASIELKKVVVNEIAPQPRKETFNFTGKKHKVSLGGLAPGFYALILPKGVYQISAVNTPYYDLPYTLDTSHDVRWQFNVFSGHLNYIGHLTIDSERSSRHVSVGLHNRIAKDIQQLPQIIGDKPNALPLRLGSGFKDEYLSLIEGSKQ